MGTSLQQSVSAAQTDADLGRVLLALADAVSQISFVLRGLSIEEAEGQNTFGDQQLNVDVKTDEIVFRHLRECGAVKTASSEEQTECQDMGGHGFSVAFDPLDGSSIVGANFAVGSIFGIWPGSELIGRRGNEQVAAAYAVYGPRTVLVIALCPKGKPHKVQQYLLTPQADSSSQWTLQQDNISIGDKAIYAPANLRAAVENAEYHKLMQYWMANKYTLRYSGGMVPDVHHILTKGGGVFTNPISKSAPAKLRLLYEAAPLGLVITAAGGLAECSQGSVLDLVISQTDLRTSISLGCESEVARSRPAMQWQ